MNKFKAGDRVVYKKNPHHEYIVEKVEDDLILPEGSYFWKNQSYFTYSPSYIQEMFEADYEERFPNTVLFRGDIFDKDEWDGEYVHHHTFVAFEMYKHLLNKF